MGIFANFLESRFFKHPLLRKYTDLVNQDLTATYSRDIQKWLLVAPVIGIMTAETQIAFRYFSANHGGRDTEIGGHKILQNTSVVVSFGAANRDPAVFPNARARTTL